MPYKCPICRDCESSDNESDVEYPSDLTSESDYDSDHHSRRRPRLSRRRSDESRRGSHEYLPGLAKSQRGSDESQRGSDNSQRGSDESQRGSDNSQRGSDESQRDKDDVKSSGHVANKPVNDKLESKRDGNDSKGPKELSIQTSVKGDGVSVSIESDEWSETDPSDDEEVELSEDTEEDSDYEHEQHTEDGSKRPRVIRSTRHLPGGVYVTAPRPAGKHRSGPSHPKPAGKWHRRIRRSYVKFATGKKFPITVPKVHGWKCGKKTKFITLNPRGRMGRREYTIVAKEMDKTIRKHQNCENAGGCFTKYRIKKVQKLINGCLWKRYRMRLGDVAREAGFANERMLFHGTTAANTADIINTGFDERHANINGMFGAGLYFAKHSSKCNQYTYGFMGGNGCPRHHDKGCFSCPRKILLCRVVLGKQKRYLKEEKLAHAPVGYHSVLGVPSKKGLWFPEYIVYRGEQIYPEYLVTYTIAT